MTLKNGSPEEVRAILKHLWHKYNIPLIQWEAELKQMGYKVSLSTLHRFLKYDLSIGDGKLYALRELLAKLKQRYPEELIDKPQGVKQ